MNFKTIYEQILKTNKLIKRECIILEKQFQEALELCETTEDKKICMQAILKNCDRIDFANDAIKFYEKKLADMNESVH